MLYFRVNQALQVIAILDSCPKDIQPSEWAKQPGCGLGAGWLNRNDISQNANPMVLAEQLADSATKLTGRTYLATDAGECVSPRYDIVEAPAVGDDVSRGFNGDFYPAGKVTKISKEYRIITVEGPRGVLRFYRRKLTGAWLQAGGTWSLVPGVRAEWNAEF